MNSTKNWFPTACRAAASGCLACAIALAATGCDRGTDSASPAGTTSATAPAPAVAPAYGSNLELVDCTMVAGWVWDAKRPNTPLKVDIYDGDTLLGTATADLARKDLSDLGMGDGKHGFKFTTPASVKDGKTHSIRVTVSQTRLQLSNSPKSLTCEPGESARPQPDRR